MSLAAIAAEMPAKSYVPPAGATDAGGENSSRVLQHLRNHDDKNISERLFYFFQMPALQKHFAGRHVGVFLELGPLRMTSVAHALDGAYDQYLGMDIGKDAVRVQNENFAAENLPRAKGIYGDAYNIPLADASVDVVFASRLTPLGSVYATKESLSRVYQEISRVLKPGGEFILYPEPRKEIKGFDTSGEIFKENGQTEIAPNESEKDATRMLFFLKR